MSIETLAFGYGLLEGPRVDAENGLYFSDVHNGGVYRRAADGTSLGVGGCLADRGRIDLLAPHRRGAG